MKFDHMRSRIISYNYNAFHSPVFSSLFAEEGTGSNVDFIERCIATKSMNLHNVSHKLHVRCNSGCDQSRKFPMHLVILVSWCPVMHLTVNLMFWQPGKPVVVSGPDMTLWRGNQVTNGHVQDKHFRAFHVMICKAR